MNEEITDNIKLKLVEISSLIRVLKNALDNPERMTEDVAHYGKFVSLIEQKLNSLQNDLHKN